MVGLLGELVRRSFSERKLSGSMRRYVSHRALIPWWRLCCINHLRVEFPLTQTELRHSHRNRGAELGEAIEQCGSYLKLGHLAIEITGHDAFAQKFQTAHFGFDQATPMVAAPSLPDRSPQPIGGFHDFVS